MITIKTFLQNKKMLIAVAVNVLFRMLLIIQQCLGIYYDLLLPYVLGGGLICLICFWFEVSAFICSFNGKAKASIVCACYPTGNIVDKWWDDKWWDDKYLVPTVCSS